MKWGSRTLASFAVRQTNHLCTSSWSVGTTSGFVIRPVRQLIIYPMDSSLNRIDDISYKVVELSRANCYED